MPATVDSATAHLIALSHVYRQHYLPGIADTLQRHGKLSRMMPMERRTLDGPSMQVTVAASHNRSTRATLDLMDPMPDPGLGEYVTYTVNFDHTDSAVNDFIGLEIGFRTTFFDIKKQSDSTWKGSDDPIRRDFEQGMADVKETFARYLHLPVDGLLATGSAKKNDDSDIFADATSYSSSVGKTTAAIQVADTSIARIGIGQMIEFRNSSNVLVVNRVRVTYVNPYDKAIHVKLTTTGDNVSEDSAGAPVTNMDGVGATDKIYLSGNYNVAPKGTLAAFFDITKTYYSRARNTDSTYRILQPIRIKLGTLVDLNADHIRRAGETVSWQEGDSNARSGRAMVMARDQYRAVSKFAKDEGISIVPARATEVGADLRRQVGEDGFVIYDPNMGQMAIVVEDFAEYGQIDFLDMSTWEMVTPWSDSEFQMIPGPIAGMWSRESENDGSGRPSKRFSAQGIWSFCFINTGAIRNLRLQGLNTAA